MAVNQNDAARRQGIRQALLALSSRDNIKEVRVTAPKLPAYLVQDDGTVLRQSAKKHKLDSETSSIVPINETNIYPGCIVYANEKLVNGYPQEVDFGKASQLGKVTVYLNFLTKGEAIAEHNVDANGSSIKAAIGRILQRGLASGSVPPAQVQEVRNTYSNIEKMALDMGVSADFLQIKCKVDTKTTSGSTTIYSMDSFSQAFYTVIIEPEGKDKTNYFGEGVTADDIRRAASVAPLAIISSVTYGRRGFYKKEYNSSDFTFNGTESLSYKKNSFSSAQDITKNTKTSNQYGCIYGGDANTAGQALNPDDFNKKMKTRMVVSTTNQGIPVFYTVQYLASGADCMSKTTGEYNDVSYAPAIHKFTLDVNQSANVMHGTNTVCLRLYANAVKIDGDGNIVDRRAEIDMENYDWSNNSGICRVYELGPNEYFENNEILVKLKARADKIHSWNTKKEGYIDLSGAADGRLYIKITGHHRKSLDLSTDDITSNGQVVGKYLGFK